MKQIPDTTHQGVECPELVEGQQAVYILECNDSSYYVGCTNNLYRRVNDHNSGIAASWTNKRRPVILLYYEIYPFLEEARRREKQLKGWSREKKQKLISGEWKQQLNAGIV